MRLQADDLLLEHGRDQGLEHPVGAANPQAGQLTGELVQPGMDGPERGRLIAGPEQIGQGLEQPAGARTPGRSLNMATGAAGPWPDLGQPKRAGASRSK